MSITQKYSQRAEYLFRKTRKSSERLEKAKRIVLVRSKYTPVENEQGVVKSIKSKMSLTIEMFLPE